MHGALQEKKTKFNTQKSGEIWELTPPPPPAKSWKVGVWPLRDSGWHWGKWLILRQKGLWQFVTDWYKVHFWSPSGTAVSLPAWWPLGRDSEIEFFLRFCISADKGSWQNALPMSVAFQVPSVQNNQCAKAAHFGVAGPGLLRTLPPNAATFWGMGG